MHSNVRPIRAATTPTSDINTNSSSSEDLGGLFEHVARPEWGLGTRVANSDGRASFQFQDGSLRKIALSYLHLLREVDRPRDEAEMIQGQLEAKAGLTLARRSRREGGEKLITLDEQVRLFLEDFEDGFEDKSYSKKHRGGGKRRAKRHRDPAIAQAQELFARDTLMQLLSETDYAEIIRRVDELLTATSLVNKRQLQPVKLLETDPRSQRLVATALCEVLYGDVETSRAMQALIDAFACTGKGVSWQLATAVPALVQPDKHFCVINSVAGQQIKWMAPRLKMNKTPSGKLYVRLLAMAGRIREELDKRDLTPRDYLDVSDFVWLTLRPKSRKRIAAMPPAPEESHERAVTSKAVTSKKDEDDASDDDDSDEETLAA